MNAKTVFSRFWLRGYAMLTPPASRGRVVYTAFGGGLCRSFPLAWTALMCLASEKGRAMHRNAQALTSIRARMIPDYRR